MDASDEFDSLSEPDSQRRPTGLDPRQQQIWKALQELSPELAEFFLSAVMIHGDPGIPSRSMLLANLAREIDGGLRDILGGSKAKRDDGEDEAKTTHRQEVADMLGLPADSPVAMEAFDAVKDWEKFAHRRGEQDSQKVQWVEAKWQPFQDLLYYRVSDYYDAQPELNTLLEVDVPSCDDITRLKRILSRPARRAYFFRRLDKPSWLEPLREAKFFDSTPGPEHDEQEGTIRFVDWPEGFYLVRMAPVQPETVGDICCRLLLGADLGNLVAGARIVEAALNMPAKYKGAVARALAKAFRKHLRSGRLMMLPPDIGKLIAKLVREEQAQAAFCLAQSVLRLSVRELPPTTLPGKVIQRREAVAPLGSWEFVDIVKEHYPALVEARGLQALVFLCDLLKQAVEIEDARGGSPNDLSHAWRVLIEQSPDYHKDSVKHALVDAVLGASRSLVESKPELAMRVLDELHNRPFRVFHRIELYLLAEYPDIEPERAVARLADKSLFADLDARREYEMLAEKLFGELAPDQQAVVLGWIADGPDTELIRNNRKEWGGVDTSEEEMREICDEWRRDRLGPVHKHLDPDWSKRYEDLVTTYGESARPERQYPTVTRGPRATKTEAELSEMAAEEVIQFLKEWQPDPNAILGPSREGQGRQFTALVEDNPAPFAERATEFLDLGPTYARCLLTGLEKAAKEGRQFDWKPVLDLCCEIATMPAPKVEAPPSGEEDPDWTWCQGEIPTLLEAGFAEGETEIPFEYRQQVWECLQPLTKHPNPTPTYEMTYGGANMDPASLAINTVRGKALEAAIRYGVWCARHLAEDAQGPERPTSTLVLVPELRKVLDEHLDPTTESSLAIHSVYGLFLSLLTWLDSEWVRANVGRIFPREESMAQARKAAWDAYIGFNRAYRDIVDMLRNEYLYTLDLLKESGAERIEQELHLVTNLVEHVVVLYLWGAIELEDELLRRVWGSPAGKMRGAVAESIGRLYSKSENRIPSTQAERVMALWEARVQALESTAGAPAVAQELETYGWVFAVEGLDVQQSADLVVRTLRITGGRTEWSRNVVERLATIAGEEPLKAAEALEMLIDAEAPEWILYDVRQYGRAVIEAAVKSRDEKARAVAVRCINRMGERGFDDFRDMLPLGPE